MDSMNQDITLRSPTDLEIGHIEWLPEIKIYERLTPSHTSQSAL
jgi:hypothetical protein